MTKPLRKAVDSIVKCLPVSKKILEIGSWQERNQHEIADLRPLFPEAVYIGTDMRPGPGVDKVANANNLPFADRSFDLVFCLETLEHADKPWLVAGEIERVLKPSGIAIVSSQQNFPIHNYPSDYFRYTPYGLAVLFKKFQSTVLFSISPPFDGEVATNPQAVVLVGSRKNDPKLMTQIRHQLKRDTGQISVHKPYRHRLQEAFRILRRAFDELFFRQEIYFFRTDK